MKANMCLLLLVILWAGSATTAGAADLQQEFLGVKWGVSVSGLVGFSELAEKDAVSYYVNPAKVYTLNAVKIPQVVFGFYEDKFFAALIPINGIDVYSKIRSALTEKYGQPRISMTMPGKQTIYTWRIRHIKIKLKRSDQFDQMKLAFYYWPVAKKINLVRQKNFQKKSNRFFQPNNEKAMETMRLLEF